ncbi:hypothetical protein DFH07DRAFT_991166 [Mycena maculata]|uniref:Glycosyltransferase family 18 catalytic domain-containing protein n=1 Tax=Mycena maculata TaxID=230809 RepID=A0AAD7JVH1_9AGAR|nr:hypothetical protein DFH07DRAFT_991166 [Mycena maculata]
MALLPSSPRIRAAILFCIVFVVGYGSFASRPGTQYRLVRADDAPSRPLGAHSPPVDVTQHRPVRAGALAPPRPLGGHSPLVDVILPDVPQVPEASEIKVSPWQTLTRKALRALFLCIDANTCQKNQEKVIIVETMYFRTDMAGHIGGEEIWANSTMLAMNNLGYTVLYAEDMMEAAQMYRMIPNLVKIVIANDWDVFACWKDKRRCVQSAENPTGIPDYKMFSFYFWPGPNNPLGPKWVLSPEPYYLEPGIEINTTYLGYSIEHACALTEFVPVEARVNQAWILAKLLSYIDQSPWTTADYDTISRYTGLRYALGARLHDGETASPAWPLPREYANHVPTDKAAFMRRIAQSKVLIGIGNPVVSPTPWDALCLGVPFINPLHTWDAEHPEETTKWRGQHAFVSMVGKPYVYNVRRNDNGGFVRAVRDAVATPIGSYVPERMRMSAVEGRLDEIVNHDWETEAKKQAEWCHEPCGCRQPCDMAK